MFVCVHDKDAVRVLQSVSRRFVLIVGQRSRALARRRGHAAPGRSPIPKAEGAGNAFFMALISGAQARLRSRDSNASISAGLQGFCCNRTSVLANSSKLGLQDCNFLLKRGFGQLGLRFFRLLHILRYFAPADSSPATPGRSIIRPAGSRALTWR